MANISITNYCNLQCEYCFADKMINEKKYYIKQEEFDSILQFLSDSDDRIGIIGGEPTLHPEFKSILDTLKNMGEKYNKESLIFTNGIFLGKYAEYINNSISCLINVNHPEIIGAENFNNIKQSILDIKNKGCISNVGVGINIYPHLQDYNYIFDIANLACQNTIRVSCCSPSGRYTNMNQDEYYKSVKDIFINFIIDATQLGFKINVDCNRIPECYLNKSDRAVGTDYILGSVFVCNPVIDIFPDMTASSCFGCYNRIDLKSFNSFNDALQYFCSIQHRDIHILDKCMTCLNYKFNICQGGCLTFSKQRKTIKNLI